MPGRSAATLVEVLVAIFVMGLGMLAILALFPLGALTMAQAIRDSRTGQSVKNARAIATAQDIYHDANLNTVFDLMYSATGSPNWVTSGGVSLPKVDPNGPSYPVLVDPIGYYPDPSSPATLFYGPHPNPPLKMVKDYLPRLSPSFITTGNITQNTYKWFSLLDDIFFDNVGNISFPKGNPFDRDIRFSWAYLMQRPKWSEANFVKSSVIVFESRSLTLSGALTLPEHRMTATVTSNQTYRITGPNPLPPLKVGDWLMEATVIPAGASPNPAVRTPLASFSRVVGLMDNGTSYDVEVDQAIPYPNANPPPLPRTLMFFENVVGVY